MLRLVNCHIILWKTDLYEGWDYIWIRCHLSSHIRNVTCKGSISWEILCTRHHTYWDTKVKRPWSNDLGQFVQQVARHCAAKVDHHCRRRWSMWTRTRQSRPLRSGLTTRAINTRPRTGRIHRCSAVSRFGFRQRHYRQDLETLCVHSTSHIVLTIAVGFLIFHLYADR